MSLFWVNQCCYSVRKDIVQETTIFKSEFPFSLVSEKTTGVPWAKERNWPITKKQKKQKKKKKNWELFPKNAVIR